LSKTNCHKEGEPTCISSSPLTVRSNRHKLPKELNIFFKLSRARKRFGVLLPWSEVEEEVEVEEEETTKPPSVSETNEEGPMRYIKVGWIYISSVY
jgi:hypothetical protein